MKRLVKALVLSVLIFVIAQGLTQVDCNIPGIVQSVEAESTDVSVPTTEATTEETTQKVDPIKLKVETQLRLYKGDKTYIDVFRPNRNIPATFTSSNQKVATVSRKGLITAKHCGKTIIVATISDGESVQTLRIQVIVSKSSYLKRNKNGNGIKKGDKVTMKAYEEMFVDESISIKASSRTPGASCTIRSSNKKVAEIENGKVIAKKKGGSYIVCTAKKGKQKTSLKLRINVTKKPIYKVTPAMQDSWFKDATMAGHSVGVGFQMYCRTQYNGFLGNCRHISVGCYGVYNDKAPVSGGSLHPTINGAKRRLKDHVTALGIKKIFINYGLNDIGVFGPDRFIAEYEGLINELCRQNPNTRVYIVSVTPVMRPSGPLNNPNILYINKTLKKYAEKKKNVKFVDVCTPLMAGTGGLLPAYCSDAYCHMTFKGYDVYSKALKEFAVGEIREDIDAADAAYTKKEADKYK